MRRNRRAAKALIGLGAILAVLSGVILLNHFYGYSQSGPALNSAALPANVAAPTSPVSTPVASASPSTIRKAATTASPREPCIPAVVVIPGHNNYARISAHDLNPDGSLFVPSNPKEVSWSKQDVAPGSPFGTAILISHINFSGVQGAFSDLASYQVGQTATVICSDQRHLSFVVAAKPIAVKKAQLDPRRQELFDQTHSYGPVGKPKTGRLLFMSCGGPFDNRTGHYEDNIFVYLLPA